MSRTEDLSKGEIVIYQNENGNISFEAKLEDETIWLTQYMMAKLFETIVPNINMHIKNVYDEEELEQKRTIKDFLIVQKEGKRTVSRNIPYSLYASMLLIKNFVLSVLNRGGVDD